MAEITIKKIYFATKDGGIIDSYDLAKASLIIAGEGLDCENLDAVRRFALACAGIVREVDNPSVKYLVANGFKTKAVMLWHDKHPGTTLKEAYAAVNRMERNLTRTYKKGAEKAGAVGVEKGCEALPYYPYEGHPKAKEEKDGSCD